MPFELVRDYITIDQEVSSFDTQTSIEELIKIPDYKPNMRNVMFVKGNVNVASHRIEENVLSMEGEAIYKVYYIAEGGYLECTQVLVPYDYSVEIVDLSGDTECVIKSNFEHIDYKITNSRKINIRSILRIEGRVTKKNNFPILRDVKELADIQKLQDKITITKSTIKNKEKISIRESFLTEEVDETALKYVDSTVSLREIKSSKSPSGVLLSGKIDINTLYSVEYEEDKEYKTIEESVSFTHFVEKKDIDNIHYYYFKPYIDYEKFDFRTDENKEQIFLDSEIAIITDVVLYENIEIENIQDLYSPKVETNLETEEIKSYFIVEEFTDTLTVSDEIIVASEYPLEDILITDVNPVIIGVSLQGKYVQVEGVLESTFITKMLSEVEILEKVEKEIPFTYNIHTNSEGGNITDFSGILQGGTINQRGNSILLSQDIMIKGNLSQSVKLNMIKSINEVQGVEEESLGEYYKIKAYYKQPGDTLWNIAKNNGTTVGKILEDNEYDCVEKVSNYTPLVIIK